MDYKKKLGVSLSLAFEYYDIAVYAAIATYIIYQFFPKELFGVDSSLLLWMTYGLRLFSRPFGGFLIGLYADYYGRKKALILTSTITGAATLCMSFMPTYHQVGLIATVIFFLMQLLQSFSFGAESPTAISYLMEDAKENERARIGGMLWGASMFSVVLSLTVCFALQQVLTEAQMFSFGWRIPLFLGVINLLISFYFKLKLIESKAFIPHKKVEVKIHPFSSFKIFLIMIPTAIIIYSNTFSCSILVNKFTDSEFYRSILPILFNLTFLIACIVLGYVVDRYFSCQYMLKKVYFMMVILGVPIYALQETGSWIALFVSQAFITLLVATTLCCTPAAMFAQTTYKHRITTIAVGYNVAISVFGAFSPLLVNFLSSFGQAYVGLLMSFGGLCYFAALALDKYTQPASDQVSTAS